MEKTNTKAGKFVMSIQWIFFFLFIVIGLAELSGVDQAILSALVFFVIAFLLLPPLTDFWQSKFPFLSNRTFLGLVIIGLLIIAAIAKPDSKKSITPQQDHLCQIQRNLK